MSGIVSGTTTERILRTLVITAMLTVFSAWFLYDGYVTWPRDNLEKAVEALSPVPDELPTINTAITGSAARQFKTELDAKRATGDRLTRKDLNDRLGQPGWQDTDEGVIRCLYFGPAGVMEVQVRGDLLTGVTYDEAMKDEAELIMQKVLGYGLLPLAVAMIFQTVRVVTTKIVLSDQGLQFRGRPVIPFEAMTSLDTANYSKKGYVDLVYSLGGKSKKVRLDQYIICEYRSIITEICGRRAFENPLPAPTSEDANAVE